MCWNAFNVRLAFQILHLYYKGASFVPRRSRSGLAVGPLQSSENEWFMSWNKRSWTIWSVYPACGAGEKALLRVS